MFMFPRQPLFAFRLALLAAMAVCALGVNAVRAQDDGSVPLYEREPFDIIKVRGSAKPLKIKPLPAKERNVPDGTKRTGSLTILLSDNPDTPYEVAWVSVENIQFFERMVLAEAEKVFGEGKHDTAFDYYRFLQSEYPNTLGFPESYKRYLSHEAQYWKQAGRFDLAYSMLVELYQRDRNAADLETALGEATQALVEKAVEKEDFAVARSYAKSMRERFSQSASAAASENRLRQLAEETSQAGRVNLNAGRMAEAYDRANLALRIWPADQGARELLTELAKVHPRIVVGVTSPSLERLADGFADRGALRHQQLTSAQLARFRGYGPDGAEYDSPYATIEEAELGRRLIITIQPGKRWSADGAELTGADVARRMLSLASPGSAGFRPELAELLDGVSVREVYQVECDLTRQFVKPMALLNFELTPGYGESGTLAPYQLAESSDAQRRFVFNPLFPPEPGAPHEIVERHYLEGADALAALRRGDISVIDRVNPRDLETLRRERDVTVMPYATPTLHVLVPNRNRPYMGDRNFRRALLYGIHRQAMLEKLIFRGAVPAGNRVLCGPFPQGNTADDPRGYAANSQVTARPYDPRLAITLIGVARLAKEKADNPAPDGEEANKEASAAKEEKAPRKPITLRIAYPASDVARAAVQSIARQWKPLGIELEMFEFGADVTDDALSACDLVYRELTLREPVVEARRLLGSDGALGSSNAYLDLALARLLEADSSRESRDRLREIYRLAAEDVTVLPLWQLTDNFAYHNSLSGVGDKPGTLYQDVRAWRATPRLPAVDE